MRKSKATKANLNVKHVVVFLDPEIDEELCKNALKEGIRVSALIARIITENVQKEEKNG